MMGRRAALRLGAMTRRFCADERGANAIEFSILALPFVALLLFVLQIGIYSASQAALDTAIMKTSEDLQGRFTSDTSPSLPSATELESSVAANAGGLIYSGSNLKVEIQPLQNLSAGLVGITDGLTDYGTPKTVLAIRASYVSTSFVPGMTRALTIYSSALVRRQAQ